MSNTEKKVDWNVEALYRYRRALERIESGELNHRSIAFMALNDLDVGDRHGGMGALLNPEDDPSDEDGAYAL